MSITINTKYVVYNHAGTGVRHHHFTEQNTVESFPLQTAEPNEVGNRIAYAPAVHKFNNNTEDLSLAFMSVNGAKGGNKLYLDPGSYLYQVGTSNIEVLAVYAPAGGIGPPGGGPGIWVDAFNVDVGNFSDDLHFIQILTPPTPPDLLDGPKTDEANQDGDVSSENPEHIRASETIDSNVPFVKWKQIMPPQQIVDARDFELEQEQTGEIWFAFYQSQIVDVPRPDRNRDWVFPVLSFIIAGWIHFSNGNGWCIVCGSLLPEFMSFIFVAIGIGVLIKNKVFTIGQKVGINAVRRVE